MTLFGPVITPAPTGEAAGADWRHIDTGFRPYLEARDWHTVQSPVA
jgi:hypothetical protein